MRHAAPSGEARSGIWRRRSRLRPRPTVAREARSLSSPAIASGWRLPYLSALHDAAPGSGPCTARASTWTGICVEKTSRTEHYTIRLREQELHCKMAVERIPRPHRPADGRTRVPRNAAAHWTPRPERSPLPPRRAPIAGRFTRGGVAAIARATNHASTPWSAPRNRAVPATISCRRDAAILRARRRRIGASLSVGTCDDRPRSGGDGENLGTWNSSRENLE